MYFRFVGFVDDVLTSCFCITGQCGKIKDNVNFRRVCQVAAPEAKSDICDCLVPVL